MKICPICHQTYADDSLNFCLNDGGNLQDARDEPPTAFMNRARTTNQNWQTPEPFSAPSHEPITPWQNQQASPNSPFMTPPAMPVQNQTLPTVSLVLGILSLVLICCFGGIPFGIAAVVTGYIGMNNANNSPMQYGGRGLAIAGMITGAVSFLGAFIWLLLAALGKH